MTKIRYRALFPRETCLILMSQGPRRNESCHMPRSIHMCQVLRTCAKLTSVRSVHLCGYIGLFCGDIGLFGGEIGLFCGESKQNWRPWGVCTRRETEVGLFGGNLGLFCGDIELFLQRYRALLRRTCAKLTSLRRVHQEKYSCCGDVGLFVET